MFFFFEYTLTVEEFNRINEKEFDKCKIVLQKIFADAKSKISVSQIDEVILVGGSTYIPKIREIVQDFTQKIPHCTIAPELVVARGAAVLARSIIYNDLGVTFKDIISKNIGVEEKGENMSVICKKFSSLPCMKSEKYRTMSQGQERILLRVLEGNDPKSENNLVLSACELQVPPGADRVPFEIQMNINPEQLVEVLVKFSNKTETVPCKTTASMPKYTDAEIEIKRQKVKKFYEKGPKNQPGAGAEAGAGARAGAGNVPGNFNRIEKILAKAKTLQSIPQSELSTIEKWIQNNKNASSQEIEEKIQKVLSLAGNWKTVLEKII